MQITIQDEITRAAVQAALWRHVSAILENGDTFADEAWGCADRLVEGNDATSDVLIFDARLAAVAAYRADVDKVADAALGDAIELTASEQEIASSAMHIAVGLAEDQRFWDREPTSRGRVLAVYDAIQELVAELTEPAEAVA